MNDFLYIGKGLWLTLFLTIGGMSIGSFLGCFLAVLRFNGYGRLLIDIFVSIMRGTPVILQISMFYFIMRLDVLSTGLVAFGLNSAAYLAEIFRASIESIPKGQFEASRTLSIPFWLMWRDIILPQAIKNGMPAFLNEFIALMKETALISTISGGLDVMGRAQSLIAEHYTYFMPLCVAALYYYGLVLLAELIGKKCSQLMRYKSQPVS